MRFASAMLVATGCRGILGIEDPQLVADGTPDVIDAPAICATWHPRLFEPCSIPAPGRALALDATGSPFTLDTTDGTLRDTNGVVQAVSIGHLQQSDGSELALLDVESFTIAGATLNVIGNQPLLVASWDFIDIDGAIDVGSHRNGRIGAGANACAVTQTGEVGSNALDSGGSGGGGGGALRGNGGNGGGGDSGVAAGGKGAQALAVPGTLRGGCAGGASGTAGNGAVPPATSATRSAGGAGGGAIQLAARLTLTLHASAAVLAGGAGGAGASGGSECGGGGGGSGGTIGFDAPTVTLDGVIAANGGGGGGSAPFADAGNGGSDGLPGTTAAPGGAAHGTPCGLAGGNGGAGSVLAGVAAAGSDTCGGGGGGGGAGFVLVWAQSLDSSNATTSPGEIVNPP